MLNNIILFHKNYVRTMNRLYYYRYFILITQSVILVLDNRKVCITSRIQTIILLIIIRQVRTYIFIMFKSVELIGIYSVTLKYNHVCSIVNL